MKMEMLERKRLSTFLELATEGKEDQLEEEFAKG